MRFVKRFIVLIVLIHWIHSIVQEERVVSTIKSEEDVLFFLKIKGFEFSETNFIVLFLLLLFSLFFFLLIFLFVFVLIFVFVLLFLFILILLFVIFLLLLLFLILRVIHIFVLFLSFIQIFLLVNNLHRWSFIRRFFFLQLVRSQGP